MVTIGVDIGTSGCKSSAVCVDGTVLASAYREYMVRNTTEGGQELDSGNVMDCAKQVLRQVAEQIPSGGIKALSVSSIGESVIPLSKSGEILGPAILYSDPRGADVEAELGSRVDHSRFFERTGYKPSRVSSVCRMMWLKRHCPDLYGQTAMFLPMNALLLYQLGAAPHTDVTLASTSQAFDIWTRRWDQDILSAAEIRPTLLPPVVEPGTVVGRMSPAAAMELGLSEGILLVAGGHDQQCVSLGAGVVHCGDVLDGMGSVEAIGVVTDGRLELPSLAKFNLSVEPHVVPGKYSVYGCTMTAGRAVKWFRDCLCRDLSEKAKEEGLDVYQLMFEELPESAGELMWVPYFSGAGTPFNDPGAVGNLAGVALDTSRGMLLKALLEGIAFEMEINLECMKAAGVPLGHIRAVGGLAKSVPYLQWKADLMGRKVTTLCSNEAGALGAAILGAVACGAYHTPEEAADKMVKCGPCLNWNEETHQRYRGKYERYKRMHPLYGELDIGPCGQ